MDPKVRTTITDLHHAPARVPLELTRGISAFDAHGQRALTRECTGVRTKPAMSDATRRGMPTRVTSDMPDSTPV